MEFTSVNRGDVEQDVIGAGDGVGAQHIRRVVQSLGELGVAGFGMFGEGDQDEGFDAQSDLLVINDASDSLDSAVAAERVAAGEIWQQTKEMPSLIFYGSLRHPH